MLVINGNKNPLIIAAFWIGIMIFIIRFLHGIPKIIADSSISGLICIIEFRELLEANGIYFIVPAITTSKNVSYIPNAEPKVKNAIPMANAGNRYGKKAILLTYKANLFLLFLLTE